MARMRRNTPEENKYIELLIKEGEVLYGKSDKVSFKVLDYVNEKMIAAGRRFKVPCIPGPLVGYTPKNV